MNESPDRWEEVAGVAKQTINALISRLPDDLRSEAARIGYELRKRCWDGAETLGDYDRSAHLITLYVDTICDHCSTQSLDFRREIEITYLHELGHHLGLSEDDLEKRGL